MIVVHILKEATQRSDSFIECVKKQDIKVLVANRLIENINRILIESVFAKALRITVVIQNIRLVTVND